MGKCEISGLLPWPWRGCGTSLRADAQVYIEAGLCSQLPCPLPEGTNLNPRLSDRCSSVRVVYTHATLSECQWQEGRLHLEWCCSSGSRCCLFSSLPYECRSGNRLSFISLDLLLYISNHRSLKGCVLKLAVNQIALLTQKHLHWTDWSLTGRAWVQRLTLRMMFLDVPEEFSPSPTLRKDSQGQKYPGRILFFFFLE